jgi:hypothetical protein
METTVIRRIGLSAMLGLALAAAGLATEPAHRAAAEPPPVASGSAHPAGVLPVGSGVPTTSSSSAARAAVGARPRVATGVSAGARPDGHVAAQAGWTTRVYVIGSTVWVCYYFDDRLIYCDIYGR